MEIKMSLKLFVKRLFCGPGRTPLSRQRGSVGGIPEAEQSNDLKDRITANHLRTVREAALEFAKANWDRPFFTTPSGGAPVYRLLTSANWNNVNALGASAANNKPFNVYLPIGFQATNAYGVDYQISFRTRKDTPGSGPPDDIYVMVASAALNGNEEQMQRAPKIANIAGDGAGFVTTNALQGCGVGCAQGVQGSWQIANLAADFPNFTGTYGNNGSLLATGSLSRQTISNDQYLMRVEDAANSHAGNTMQYDILMNGRDLLNAGRVQIRVDTANATALDIGTNGGSITNAINISQGTINAPNSDLNIRDITAQDITARDITSTRTITAQDISAQDISTQNMTVSGTLTSTGATRLGLTHVGYLNGVNANGRLYAGDGYFKDLYIKVNRNDNFNNSYINIRDRLPEYVPMESFVRSHGGRVTKPTCNSGTPRIILTPGTSFYALSAAWNAAPDVRGVEHFLYASNAGSSWIVNHRNVVRTEGGSRTYTNGQVIAMTYCDFG
jgi:hypothetical protein